MRAVATWHEFEAEAPELAEVAARLWPGITALHRGSGPSPAGEPTFAVAYLATTRPDGSPRLHPFCPIVAAGRLYAAIPTRSPKGQDLRRDPRCAIHAMPGPDDDELCIRARAHEDSGDAGTRAAVLAVVARSGVGGMIESVSHDPLFELQLVQVDVAVWLDVGQPGTRAVRRRWRPAPRRA
jgi:Pyridoxamine 5'-phosphate oxidase